ncbi:MAG: OmpA family protein [Roseomonas sp.]|nr:OmpA family protein [Roseomonas sp.]MCA3287269.1 OmpA family protein [Roseomonas sp.]MCA3290314.1 OmpA family protein [Roseomonas sp.]MCA3295159.1 OmpA family protein [Roseomonas sp.]
MSLKKTLLAAAAVVALPVLAQAQPISGLYLGAGVGANWQQDTTLNGSVNNTAGTKIENEFDIGYVGVLSLGWGFGNGLRAEIEGSYRSNDVSDTRVGGASINNRASATGTAVSYGVMANVLYDFDIGATLGGIVPYIGGGIGYIWHDYQDVGASFPNGDKTVYNGNTGAFGYQAILGAALPIASVPGLALTAEYRFMGTTGHDINGTVNRTGQPQDRVNADVDNFNHSLLIGLRYAFNAAPARPVAVAPMAAARTFLVFFDWSKADLTDRARQIIGEAASSRGAGVTRIEVNGFTDRSGPADYNMQLSIRRANAVAAELVRRGVPRNEIVTRGFGEENNLVPTADGVREPQNRRVEIILK